MIQNVCNYSDGVHFQGKQLCDFILPHFPYGDHSQRKEFAPFGENSFLNE